MRSHPKRVSSADDLPDDILCEILSLLSPIEAARTSILSRRWRHLFLRVQKWTVECTDANLEAMFHFIDQWIRSSEDVTVNEFRLRSKDFPEEPVFHSWLTTLLLRSIKVLELSNGFVAFPSLVRPPEEFFRSETLVDLRISGKAIVLEIPGFIYYPNLKTLHLANLHVVDESGHFRFADASYPRLEEFCLNFVYFLDGMSGDAAKVKLILTISLATLKKLVVNYEWHERFLDEVEIDTQILKHFQFTVKEESECDMKVNFSKSGSLVNADIYQFSSGESYIKLLRKINNVKTLQLSDHSPQDYNGIAGSFPQFIHLTHLKLTLTALQSVWCLLQHAPNLEVLDYDMAKKYEDYLPPAVVPQCLSESLKEIRITDYKWYEDDSDDEIDSDDETGIHTDTNTVKYFLLRGAVLKTLSLGHSKKKTVEWRHSTLNLLRNIAPLSPHCVIELKEDKN